MKKVQIMEDQERRCNNALDGDVPSAPYNEPLDGECRKGVCDAQDERRSLLQLEQGEDPRDGKHRPLNLVRLACWGCQFCHPLHLFHLHGGVFPRMT